LSLDAIKAINFLIISPKIFNNGAYNAKNKKNKFSKSKLLILKLFKIPEARRRKKTATIRTKTGRNIQKSQTKQLKSKFRARKKQKLS